MKTLLLLLLLTGQSFAALNSNSQCPKGQSLERFTPTLTDNTGTEINHDIYICVITIKKCDSVSKVSTYKSKYTGSTTKIIEGFKCSWSGGQQCQQQQQHHRFQAQRQQNTVNEETRIEFHSLSSPRKFNQTYLINSGDYVRFDNKLYRCEL